MRSIAIREIRARQILDCKGKPMLEVDVLTEGGALGRASSPSGVSAGEHEAYVLRDQNPDFFGGLSVYKCIEAVENVIAPSLKGMSVLDQEKIDNTLITLDGTPNKSHLGGNTLYSVSLACLKAACRVLNLPMYEYLTPKPITTIPLPTYNIISGGSYQKGSMPFQEITVVPYKAEDLMEAVHIGWQMFEMAPKVIEDVTRSPAKPGKLSGWQSPTTDPIVCFELMLEIANRCGVADKIAFATDCASSEFYNKERNTYDFVDRELDTDEMIGYLKEMTTRFPFLYCEDVLQENDWEGWVKANRELNRTILIGDDFTVTNVAFLKKAYELKACGGFIFKPNQVGTVTECIAAHEYAQSVGMITVPSIRAGAVANDSIFDMAVAFGAPCTKQGPPRNGERIYGINFLARVASLHPNAKPYDFTTIARCF